MDAVVLQRRFYKSAAPFNIFLQLHGVDLHPLSQTSQSRQNLIRLWGWLVLFTQCLGFIGQYVDRLLIFELKISTITQLLVRTNHLVTCLMSTHFVIFMAASRLVSFVQALEKVDSSLNRPDLSSLHRDSIIGVIWILITVNFECGCSVLNELDRINPKLIYVIQQIIKFQALAPLLSVTLMYALCAQLLIIYYRRLAIQIQQNTENIAFSIQSFSLLQNATKLLHSHLLFYMKVNCFFILVNLIQTVYNILINGPSKNMLILVWNAFVTTDLCLRLWIICHSADRIRNAALNCYWAALKFRCNSANILPPKQRRQITFFIYEVNQEILRVNPIPIGRNIIFAYADHIISFALLLWENRNTSLKT